MLKSLRIQNFKGWKDTGTISMAPLTLLFGANSSGKSSIGQFLMMLKQTVEHSDRGVVFHPGGKNSSVQLGSYREMVFQRNLENKIAFEYQWSLPEYMEIVDIMLGATDLCDTLCFNAEVGVDKQVPHDLAVEQLRYTLTQEENTVLLAGMHRNSNNTESTYEVQVEMYGSRHNQELEQFSGEPIRFYGFPNDAVVYHRNASSVQMLNVRQEELFNSIFYLGPLRTKPERLYAWTGNAPWSVGYLGEYAVAAMLAAKKRHISMGGRKTAHPFEAVIAAKLKDMGLIEELKVKPISKASQVYEVKVRSKGSKVWVDLPDVGFGISQVLPVLVQCFYAPANSIIIMEQPEIHLHPSAQSALADVMIDAINSKENGVDRNIQLIIETHSEHFLQRLQRRIAEEKISESSVSAYFANITKEPAVLEPLEIDEYGNVKNWPENFFGDEFGDIAGQAKAALKRRIKENQR